MSFKPSCAHCGESGQRRPIDAGKGEIREIKKKWKWNTKEMEKMKEKRKR